MQVWHADDRARIEAYTHWGIIGFAGLLVRKNTSLLHAWLALSLSLRMHMRIQGYSHLLPDFQTHTLSHISQTD